MGHIYDGLAMLEELDAWLDELLPLGAIGRKAAR